MKLSEDAELIVKTIASGKYEIVEIGPSHLPARRFMRLVSEGEIRWYEYNFNQMLSILTENQAQVFEDLYQLEKRESQ